MYLTGSGSDGSSGSISVSSMLITVHQYHDPRLIGDELHSCHISTHVF